MVVQEMVIMSLETNSWLWNLAEKRPGERELARERKKKAPRSQAGAKAKKQVLHMIAKDPKQQHVQPRKLKGNERLWAQEATRSWKRTLLRLRPSEARSHASPAANWQRLQRLKVGRVGRTGKRTPGLAQQTLWQPRNRRSRLRQRWRQLQVYYLPLHQKQKPKQKPKQKRKQKPMLKQQQTKSKSKSKREGCPGQNSERFIAHPPTSMQYFGEDFDGMGETIWSWVWRGGNAGQVQARYSIDIGSTTEDKPEHILDEGHVWGQIHECGNQSKVQRKGLASLLFHCSGCQPRLQLLDVHSLRWTCRFLDKYKPVANEKWTTEIIPHYVLYHGGGHAHFLIHSNVTTVHYTIIT